jgi:hypothetical protein
MIAATLKIKRKVFSWCRQIKKDLSLTDGWFGNFHSFEGLNIMKIKMFSFFLFNHKGARRVFTKARKGNLRSSAS